MPQNTPPQSNIDEVYAHKLYEKRGKDLLIRQTTITNQSDAHERDDDKLLKTDSNQTIEFPTKMLVLALCFDILGFIPVIDIVCIVTEPLAGLIFYRWQKKYAPETNPLGSLLINKAIDLMTIGISPSNSILVFRTYSKKKIANVL